MTRYFRVDELTTNVRRTKCELDDLGERLKILKQMVCNTAAKTCEDDLLPFRFRTNQYEKLPKYGRRFVYDSEIRSRKQLDRKKRSKCRQISDHGPSNAVDENKLPIELRINLELLKSRLGRLRHVASKNTVQEDVTQAESKKVVVKRKLLPHSQLKHKTVDFKKSKEKLTKGRPVNRPLTTTSTTFVINRKNGNIRPTSRPKPTDQPSFRLPNKYRRPNYFTKQPEKSGSVDRRVVEVPKRPFELLRRKYEISQSGVPLLAEDSIEKKIIDRMREKYFGNAGKSCVYRIINAQVPNIGDERFSRKEVNTKTASVQTSDRQRHLSPEEIKTRRPLASSSSSIPVELEENEAESSFSISASTERVSSSSSSVKVNLRRSTKGSSIENSACENGQSEISSSQSEMTAERSNQNASENDHLSKVPTLEMKGGDNIQRWKGIHAEALRAYYYVQMALLNLEKVTANGGDKGTNEYYSRAEEELKQSLKKEISSLHQSEVSLSDELRNINDLQQKTAELQKRLTEQCAGVSHDVKLQNQQRLVKLGDETLDSERSSTSESGKFNGQRLNDDQATPISGRSDYESRVRALKKELQMKKDVARKLTYEYQQRSKEQFQSHERSLAKQIEIYDNNISQTQKLISDLECENPPAEDALPSDHQSPETLTYHFDQLPQSTPKPAGRAGDAVEQMRRVQESAQRLSNNLLLQAAEEVYKFLSSQHAEPAHCSQKDEAHLAHNEAVDSEIGQELCAVLTKPVVPRLDLDEAEGEVVASLDTPMPLANDGRSEEAPCSTRLKFALPLVVVQMLIDVSFVRLYEQAALGNNLWHAAKPAELYFVGCDVLDDSQSTGPKNDHAIRDFIFDLCREVVAHLFGTGDSHRLGVGGPAMPYIYSSCVIRKDAQCLKKVVSRIVMSHLLGSSSKANNARIASVCRHGVGNVELAVLNDLYEEEPAWRFVDTEEEQQLNERTASLILERLLNAAVGEVKRFVDGS